MKRNLAIYTNTYIIIAFLSFVQLESADLQILRSGNANTILNATTITESGNYELGRDITGPITIAANDVHIDLKNFIIQGGTNGISINGFSRIKICNGYIRNVTAEGILIDNCSDVCIDNLKIFSCQLSGIKTISSTNTNVLNSVLNDNNTANNSSHAGFFDQSSTGSFIYNVRGSGNQQAALSVQGTASQSIIRSCVFNDNPSRGIFLDGAGVEQQLVENCVTNNNGLGGMRIQSLNNVSVIGCISINNTSYGMLFASITNGVIKNNIANLNSITGIAITSSTTVCCVNNITNNNAIVGIENISGSVSSFFLNKAQENGSANYSGVNLIAVYDISMGMFTTGPATAFDNISVVP